MRIASSQFEATMNRGLEFNQENISKLTEQLATGNAIQLPSDDPVTDVRLSRLEREQDTVTQYRANIGALKTRLSNNESYLTGVVNDITQASDQLVWASDGSNSSADLNSMVSTLQSVRDSIFFAANTKDSEGHYIFSGNQTNTAAITIGPNAAVGSRYSYTGDTGQQEVTVGNGITQTANVNVKGLDTYLNQLDTNHANVSLSNETAISDIGQLDYGVASTELNGYNLALQASYKAYSKISSLSLFNVI